jgi:hypothetical protein
LSAATLKELTSAQQAIFREESPAAGNLMRSPPRSITCHSANQIFFKTLVADFTAPVNVPSNTAPVAWLARTPGCAP